MAIIFLISCHIIAGDEAGTKAKNKGCFCRRRKVKKIKMMTNIKSPYPAQNIESTYHKVGNPQPKI